MVRVRGVVVAVFGWVVSFCWEEPGGLVGVWVRGVL